MPLDKDILLFEIKKFSIANEKSDNMPINLIDASKKWSKALEIYCKAIIPYSTTISASKIAFESLFITMNFTGNGVVILPQCFKAFQTVLASGMAGYISTPPAVLIDISPVKILGDSGGTSEETLKLLCDLIHLNFKTGIAINPTQVVVSWT